jgi:hypothetical protein
MVISVAGSDTDQLLDAPPLDSEASHDTNVPVLFLMG